MSDFLPEGYSVPEAVSRYTKFEKDKTTKFRILEQEWDKTLHLYKEYFDVRGEKPKPIRSIKAFEETPGIKEGSRVKDMWSVKIWNYDTENVQILSIGQVSIQRAIEAYCKEEEYGSPVNYDLKISRKWDGMNTEYSVVALPPKEFDDSLLQWNDSTIDWVGFMECKTDIFKDIEDQ